MFKQMSACQKTYSNRFLGQERSADGGIHTVMSEVYCEILKAIQNKSNGIAIPGVMLLHDSVRPHAAADTGAFQLELFYHPPYSPAVSDCHLFTYLKN
jgi:hypothetical protein